MTEFKGTPGPWRYIELKTASGRIYRVEVYGPEGCGRGGHPICQMPTGFTRLEDDLRLIAAAPELLAYAECEEAYCQLACCNWEKGSDWDRLRKNLTAVLTRHGFRNGDCASEPQFMQNLRRAAIAKAIGKEPP